MAKIVNLTPHEVTIYLPSGEVKRIPPSGVVARVKTFREEAGTLEGIPLVTVRYGEVEGLPKEPEPDTYYIVSVLVAQALVSDPKWRGKLLVPDTSPQGAVRDKDGRIIGVKALQVW